MPKRPASAYLFFQNEVRSDLKKAHPFTPHHELLSLISKQWASMNESEKKVRPCLMRLTPSIPVDVLRVPD